MVDRRRFLKMLMGSAAGFFSLGGYAFAVEPRHRLAVTRHDLMPPRWPVGAPPLTVALLSDIHISDPWMPLERVDHIVATANSLGVDMILLLGDYLAGVPGFRRVAIEDMAAALGRLRAPLGVHAIMGNHDYRWRRTPTPLVGALRAAGIDVLLNQSRRIRGHGHDFWLAGTESSLAWGLDGGDGRDDLAATLAAIDDDRPIVLMAHEPAQFEGVPDRVAVTFSGHTHGGQVALPLIGAPISHHGTAHGWVRGHYLHQGRHLVVTSGLGLSFLPIRFMVPPEIAVVTLRAAPIA